MFVCLAAFYSSFFRFFKSRAPLFIIYNVIRREKTALKPFDLDFFPSLLIELNNIAIY